jgi:hypothetical protein
VDGSRFDSIGFVASLAVGGSSNQLLSYKFVTRYVSIGAKNAYYRLRQVDNNGNSRVSTVVTLLSVAPKITVSPNPVKDRIYLTVDKPGPFTYHLFDNAGRSVKTGVLHQTSIGVERLNSGIYYLRIGSTEISDMLKVVIE